MSIASYLEKKTIKELYILARRAGIAGWHEMRKSELVETLRKKIPRHAELYAELKKEMELAGATPTRRKKVTPPKDSPSTGAEKTKKNSSEVLDVSEVSPVVANRKKAPTPVKKVAVPSPPVSNPPVPLVSDSISSAEKKHPEVVPSEEVPKKSPPKEKEPELGVSQPPSPDHTVAPEPLKTTGKKKKSPTTSRKVPLEPPVPFTPPLAFVSLVDEESPEPDHDPEVQKKILILKEKLLLHKTLGSTGGSHREAKDKLMLMVRDPFWLHAYWEISQPLVDRIRAAMGHLWHTADPVLRLYRVHTDHVGALRQEYLSDIPIHGGINNWYIDVTEPPSQFLIDIGYLARDGQFFVLLSSNLVETPQRYVHDAFGHPDVSWMGVPSGGRPGFQGLEMGEMRELESVAKMEATSRPFGGNSKLPNEPISPPPFFPSLNCSFPFEVDADLVIKGKTLQNVQLKIKGESITLNDDGSFSIRLRLPERRHVYPIVAESHDGVEKQTIILAVERNTKVMETVFREEESD